MAGGRDRGLQMSKTTALMIGALLLPLQLAQAHRIPISCEHGYVAVIRDGVANCVPVHETKTNKSH